MNNTIDLIASVGDAAFVIDPQQMIVFWNESAATLLGYSVAEATGRCCWQLLDGHTCDGRPYCRPNCPVLACLRRSRSVEPFSLLVRCADHSVMRVQMSTMTVPRSDDPDDMLLLVHLVRQDHAFALGGFVP